jgi:hypothetical protein
MKMSNSVVFVLRGNFTMGELDTFSLTEKLKLSPNDFKIIKILC